MTTEFLPEHQKWRWSTDDHWRGQRPGGKTQWQKIYKEE